MFTESLRDNPNQVFNVDACTVTGVSTSKTWSGFFSGSRERDRKGSHLFFYPIFCD
ncbi:MAG: hypothetical protein PHU62_08995 [Bacteroidales bacterium]|nr:hypothetical protein [Bacteroidales bacterium]MDD2205128.1 hypothetical protein [Bacteroidales bacterium]MDD3151488.1 hypothetical protein [Bacteroidales bacterium]MDD4634686.1 hypothetical protein [Bacteroidales bacterium]